MFEVQAVYDVRAKGGTFGPFDKRSGAEQCVIALASRSDVVSVSIKETEKGK